MKKSSPRRARAPLTKAKKEIPKKKEPITLAYEDEKEGKVSSRIVSVDSSLAGAITDLRSRFQY